MLVKVMAKFYIITPVMNSLSWLKRCVYSVADQVQPGVEVYHFVQDGASTDGTVEWLGEWQQKSASRPGYRFAYESVPDAGMYDALNKAWEKLPPDADITAHLNSDEQYMPGVLARVAGEFAEHPEVELVVGAYYVVDADSRYICHRRPVQPWRWTSQAACEIITCACFHRAEAFMKHGIRFDTRFRVLSDMVFFRDLVNHSMKVRVLPELITSLFAVTGENLGWSNIAEYEWKVVLSGMPIGITRSRWLCNFVSSARRRWRDLFCEKPLTYSLYLPGEESRTTRCIQHPTSHWGCRSYSSER